MKDPRFELFAHNLLDYSLEIQPGDKLLIDMEAGAEEFACVLVAEAYKRGAWPFLHYTHPRLHRSWLLGASRAQIELAVAWELNRTKDVDAVLYILAGDNAAELADVPPKILEDSRTASRPLKDLILRDKRWCLLRFPTPAAAQAAGMSSEAFEDLCFAVFTLDYARLDKAMEPLVELMTQTDEVWIKGPGTDLRFSIKGIPVEKAAGKNNIPDGEVFTAPVLDSVNGTIRFNVPALEDGTTFENVTLVFKNGKVIEASCNEQAKLDFLLNTDEGARFVGEFALGLNPYVEKPMRDTLWDEKIAGSLHLALGRSYEETDNGNRSGLHWDLVLIQTPAWGGGEIWFDGVLVRKDGHFVLDELQGLNPENLRR